MPDRQPTIRFVADEAEAPDVGEPPDTHRTYLIEGFEQIQAALARLGPNEPLVLRHRLGDQIDLDAYTEILRTAAAAGHDIQLRLESEGGRIAGEVAPAEPAGT